MVQAFPLSPPDGLFMRPYKRGPQVEDSPHLSETSTLSLSNRSSIVKIVFWSRI